MQLRHWESRGEHQKKRVRAPQKQRRLRRRNQQLRAKLLRGIG
ncbi:hypothetical protein VZG28_06365 [Synechococcus elongatus IITB4]